MSISPLNSPVIVDGVVTDEKLDQLLALQTEYPELDYKSRLDLRETEDTVELAKDLGAMQVVGGYVIVGVDDNDAPTGDLDSVDMRPFDEASLRQKMLRYLPDPLRLSSRVTERDGHRVVIIFVGSHPSGCAWFARQGVYQKNGEEQTVFRQGRGVLAGWDAQHTDDPGGPRACRGSACRCGEG